MGSPVLDGGKVTIIAGCEGVPVARLRALLRLLYPEEMTPTAKRLIEQVIEEHELSQ